MADKICYPDLPVCEEACSVPLDLKQIDDLYELLSEKIKKDLQEEYDCKRISGAYYGDAFAKLMAVVIQQVVGREHSKELYYPSFSGVASSPKKWSKREAFVYRSKMSRPPRPSSPAPPRSCIDAIPSPPVPRSCLVSLRRR